MRVLYAGLPALILTACSAAAPPKPAPAAVTRPQADPRVVELEKTVGELLDRIEVLNARIQRIEAGAPEPATAPAPAKVAAAPAPTERRMRGTAGADISTKYRAAIELYARGKAVEARDAFQKVFDADPSGELADNALYWIGETYFAAGAYGEAMTYYKRIAVEFGDQNKAPDAMLKTGMSLARLGDLKLARRAFEELIERFPYSTPASNAKIELKRIKY
ncbi:MAG: tetratricopeptide repeat protein [Thermoanaerobaculia bacterium]